MPFDRCLFRVLCGSRYLLSCWCVAFPGSLRRSVYSDSYLFGLECQSLWLIFVAFLSRLCSKCATFFPVFPAVYRSFAPAISTPLFVRDALESAFRRFYSAPGLWLAWASAFCLFPLVASPCVHFASFSCVSRCFRFPRRFVLFFFPFIVRPWPRHACRIVCFACTFRAVETSLLYDL